MRRTRNLLFATLTALGLASATGAAATDWGSSSYGSALTDVLWDGSSTTTTGNTVFLYNVGSGLFLDAGGLWDTEGICSETGLPSHIVKEDYYYRVYYSTITSGSSLGQVNNAVTDKGVYVDCSTNRGYVYLEFAAVSDATNTYTIRTNNGSGVAGGYLTCNPDPNGNFTNIVEAASELNGTYSQWKIISEKDVIDAFEAVKNATYDSSVDVTFLIRNPQFSRDHRRVGGGSGNFSWTYTYSSGTIENRNALYETNSSYDYDDIEKNYGETKKIENDDTNGSYVNSGYGYKVTQEDIDKGYSTDAVGTSTYYCRLYGSCYNTKLTGDGYIYQTITLPRAGWYEVSCQGFNTAGNAGAELFVVKGTGIESISTDGEAVTLQTLSDDDATTIDMTEAAILFKAKKYTNNVLFYVSKSDIEENSDGVQYTIGVTVSGAGDGEYTEIDDFRLKYCGLPEYPILLDETAENLDYVVTTPTGETRTVVLKRSFTEKAGTQWNSIVLPFSLSGTQVKNYFGQNTKLARLESLTPVKIWFKSVDLTTDGLDANTCYIIKVDKATCAYVSEGSTSVAKANGDHEEVENETETANAPYIIIPMVSLETVPAESVITNDKATSGTEEITAYGVYTSQTISYTGTNSQELFAFSGGKLVRYKRNIPLKGFRCYFDWKDTTESATADISVSIDGVEDNTTAIDIVTGDIVSEGADNKVYNINGTLVRTDGSLEGLSKGVYIVNSKKYVVK